MRSANVDYPIVTMASTEYPLRIGENSPVEVKGTCPIGGAGTITASRYLIIGSIRLATDVFRQVAELDEAYRPMAKINRALVLIELDRYEEAGKFWKKSSTANPNNMRAAFQQARVFIKFGKLAEAEANLKRVLEAFPRDRFSWQQFGELCKIKRDYEGAQHSYEQILSIDPEDAGAHYNLMLILPQARKERRSTARSKILLRT